MPLVEPIKVPIDALDNISGQLKTIERNLDSFSQKRNQSMARYRNEMSRLDAQESRDMEKLKQQRATALTTTWRNFQMVGAAAVGVGLALKKTYDFAKEGAGIVFLEQKFNRLSKAAGSTGKVFLEQLRGATKGTVSDFKLLQQGSDLLQLGLAKDTKEAVRLSNVMTALGMDTGELTLALANQSKRRLDQLGLSLRRFNEIEKELKKKGYSKEEAFNEAFMLTAEETIATTGNRADSAAGSFAFLEAQFENLKIDAQKDLGEWGAPIARDVGLFFQGIRDLKDQKKFWDFEGQGTLGGLPGFWSAFMSGDSMVRNARASDFSDLWSKPGNITGYEIGGRAKEQPIVGLSATQNYTAMAYAYQREPGGGAQAALEEAMKAGVYSASIEDTMKLSENTEKLAESQELLTEKLEAEQAAMAVLLEQGYKETDKAVVQHSDNITALSGELENVAEAQEKWAEQQIVAAMQAKEANEDLIKQFTVSSGLVSQDAINQQNAIDAMAQAYADGTLDVTKYANDINALLEQLKGMDGTRANSYIDVWIREHTITATTAGVGGMGAGSNNSQTTGGGATNSSTIYFGASGGPLPPSGYVMLGDNNGAPTPYSEILDINTGYVYNARQTRKMLASGIKAKPMYTGGFADGEVYKGSGAGLSGVYTQSAAAVAAMRAAGGGLDSDAAVVVAAMVEPIVSGVSAAVSSQSMQLIASTQEFTRQAQTMNGLLAALVAKTPTAGNIGREVAVNSQVYK